MESELLSLKIADLALPQTRRAARRFAGHGAGSGDSAAKANPDAQAPSRRLAALLIVVAAARTRT